MKRFVAAPCATIQAEGALEGRDGRFDTGTKVSECLVGDAVARHLGNGEAKVLAEDDVLYAERANVGEVLSCREAAVEGDAPWDSPQHFGLPFDGAHRKGRVARISGEGLQVEDESGRVGEETLFLHADAIGTVDTISKSDHTFSAQKFDVFGAPLDPTNLSATRAGFTGHQHDDDLGFIDMKGRLYDPLAGRFTTADPVMQAPFWSQGLNRYSYAFNNPVNNVDPSGFDTWGLNVTCCGSSGGIPYSSGGGAVPGDPASGGSITGSAVGTTLLGFGLDIGIQAATGAGFFAPSGSTHTSGAAPAPSAAPASTGSGPGTPHAVGQNKGGVGTPYAFIDLTSYGSGVGGQFHHGGSVPNPEIEELNRFLVEASPVGDVKTLLSPTATGLEKAVAGVKLAATLIPAVRIAGAAEGVGVATRGLEAADLGLSGRGITALEGTVTNAGTTRIIDVANIEARTGSLLPELRGAPSEHFEFCTCRWCADASSNGKLRQPWTEGICGERNRTAWRHFFERRRTGNSDLHPGSTVMAVLVYSVVRRHMKRTSPGAFTRYEEGAALPVELSLNPGETVVGWYRNPAPWQDTVIVFTSEAFYVVDGGRIDRIAISDIVDYERPASKTDVTGLRLLTKDGFRFVRVAGSFGPSGNQKDAYSFIMIVRALIPGDLDRPSSSRT